MPVLSELDGSISFVLFYLFWFVLATVVLEDPEAPENRIFTIIPLIMKTLSSKTDTLKLKHSDYSYRKPIGVINTTLNSATEFS